MVILPFLSERGVPLISVAGQLVQENSPQNPSEPLQQVREAREDELRQIELIDLFLIQTVVYFENAL